MIKNLNKQSFRIMNHGLKNKNVKNLDLRKQQNSSERKKMEHSTKAK